MRHFRSGAWCRLITSFLHYCDPNKSYNFINAVHVTNEMLHIKLNLECVETLHRAQNGNIIIYLTKARNPAIASTPGSQIKG